jgi:hypothetical protein
MALIRVVVVKPIFYRGVQYPVGDIIDFVDDPSLLGQWVATGMCTVGFTSRVTDDQKFDVGLVPTSIASSNLTGLYFSMVGVDRAVFVCQYGPLATTGTVSLQILQGQDVVGTGSAVLAKAVATTGATEITHVAACKTLTFATLVAGTTVTVTAYKKNSATALYSILYTAQAGATNIPLRQFQVLNVSDTTDAGELLKCLNDATYGTLGIYWTNSSGKLTGQATDDSTTFTITCSVDNATDVRAEPQGQLIVEVDSAAMSVGFGWLAAKVTTTATVVCGVTLVRHASRFSPNAQQTDITPVSIIS